MRKSDDPAQRLADAMVSEIKAELGRRGMSSRALGRMIGKSSQYMSDRLDGGSSKTGKRVTLTVWDLAAIARVLGMTEVDLIERAEAALQSGTVIHGRFGRPEPEDPNADLNLDYDPDLDAVAHEDTGEPTDEQ